MATMKWTTAAQVRRVLAADARALGIDAAYGLGYVLAGFLIFLPTAFSGQQFIVAPIYALSLVIFYLTIRVCNDDRDDNTAMFFANLPRRRILTYWIHSLMLGLYILMMEVLILLGLLFRLKSSHPDSVSPTDMPYLALPWLVGAFSMWVIFGFGAGFGKPKIFAFFLMFGVFAGSAALIIWAQTISIHFQALMMLLITCCMLCDGALRWQKLQVGELP